MSTSKMSYNTSSREQLREQQRQARALLLDDSDVPSIPTGLFPEPIKVAPSPDDPLDKQITRALGKYNIMKETIFSKPQHLLGVTRQPQTPLSSHAPNPPFADARKPAKPPYHNGQHGRSRTSSSSSSKGGDLRHGGHLAKAQHSGAATSNGGAAPAAEFSKPKSVSKSSHSTSMQPPPPTSFLVASAFVAVPGTPPEAALHLPAAPAASPVKEKHRDRGQTVAAPPSGHHPPPPPPPPSKFLPPASAAPPNELRPPNGVIINGGLKSGYSRSSGLKLNLKLNVDNQVKSSKEVESILKEMIAPTPLTGIPTPRKDETKFPFPSVGNIQLEGNAVQSSAAKLSGIRPLDLNSLVQTSDKSGPTANETILDNDLEISEDSDDEANMGIRKKLNNSHIARSPGQAVLTNSPPPLPAMSPMSESSSSDSYESSSGSDSEDNSNKSHSEASDAESKPESPKPNVSWNLDNFIPSTPSMPVPFAGLPSDLAPVTDQESQSFDGGLFTPSDKGLGGERNVRLEERTVLDDEDDFCPVPHILSKDFSKEDIKNLIPSPAPKPVESIVDSPLPENNEVDEEAFKVTRSLSPIPPTPINKKKSLFSSPKAQHKVKADGKSNSAEAKETKQVLGKNGVSKAALGNFAPTKSADKSQDGVKNHKAGHKKGDLQPANSVPKSKSRSNDSSKKVGGGKSESEKLGRSTNETTASAKQPKRSSSPSLSKRSSSPPAVQKIPKPASRQNSSEPKAKPKKSALVPKSPASSSTSSLASTASSSASCTRVEKGAIAKPPVPKKGSHQKSTKLNPSKIKSRERISESDDSDSENEIDVVGTPSPLKLANGGKTAAAAAEAEASITAIINAVSTGAGTVKKMYRPPSPSHKVRSSKNRTSKSREVAEGISTLSGDQNAVQIKVPDPYAEKSCSAASKTGNEAVWREDLDSRLAPLVYKCGIPSLMVSLDISLLERVPLHPSNKMNPKTDDAAVAKKPGKSSKPKEAAGRENKRPLMPPDAKEIAAAPRGKHKPVIAEAQQASEKQAAEKAAVKKEPPSAASPPQVVTAAKKELPCPAPKETTKRTIAENDGRKSEKKKIKLSKEFGSTSSLTSSASSKAEVVAQPKPQEVKVKKEPVDKELSTASSTSNKLVKTESKSSTSAAAQSSKNKASSADKKKSASSSTVKSEKQSKAAKESVEKKKDTLKTPREKDANLPVKQEPVPEIEAERCRQGGEKDAKAKSPGRSRSNSNSSKSGSVGHVATCSPKKIGSAESVAGPSQNLCNAMPKPKDLKLRSKDREGSREQDAKRRKHDSIPSSQTSSTEAPKTNNDGIERNTNHDRIPPTAEEPKGVGTHSNYWAAILEKINAEIDPRPHHTQTYYLTQAKNLKHEADRETDRTLQAVKYLRAVLYFILAGSAMENEHVSVEAIFRMYINTSDLIKFISTKFRTQQSAPQNGSVDGKLAVLSLWCQSILYLKMFNMRRNDVRDCNKTLTDYQKNSSVLGLNQHLASPHQPSPSNASAAPSILWNNKSTGAPSPLSPLPSPAGSVGSVESQSSGYSSSEIGSQSKMCSATLNSSASLTNPAAMLTHLPQFQMISVPVHIHSTMQKQLDNLSYLSSCHNLWEQADALITRNRTQEFFINLDELCGKLTLHSSLRDLVKYVMLGLHCVDVKT